MLPWKGKLLFPGILLMWGQNACRKCEMLSLCQKKYRNDWQKNNYLTVMMNVIFMGIGSNQWWVDVTQDTTNGVRDYNSRELNRIFLTISKSLWYSQHHVLLLLQNDEILSALIGLQNEVVMWTNLWN